MKRPYETPKLTVHGSVESVTLGDRQWLSDGFVGADGTTDGTKGTKCSQNPSGKDHTQWGASLCS